MMNRTFFSASAVGAAVCVLMLSCGKGPELVLPELPEGKGRASGFISPTGLSGTVYLFEDIAFDSAVIDSATGFFSFDSVPYGAYQLRVVVPGFGIPRRVISISRYASDLGTISLSRFPWQITRVSIEDSSLIQFGSNTIVPSNQSRRLYPIKLGDTTVSLRIEFKQKIDTFSIASGVTVAPDIDHRISCTTDGTFGALTISFPVMALFSDSIVTITIGRRVKTVFGEELDFDLVLTYFVLTSDYDKAVFSIFIQRSIPSNGQWSVAPDNDILIYFRKRMNERSVENALSIKPVEPMNDFWSTTAEGVHQLRIAFPAGLNVNTAYVVTIDSTARTEDSVRMPVPITVSFTSADFRITDYFPLSGDLNVSIDTPFVYYTYVPVDSSSFLKAFSIKPALDSTWIVLQNNAKKIIVYHASLMPQQPYTIVIDTNLTTSKGVNSRYTFTQSFTASSASAFIQRASPPDTLAPVPTSDSVSIFFSQPMAPASVSSRLTVAPAVPFLTRWESSTYRLLTLLPMQILRSNTTYSVTIDSGYFSTWGKTGKTFTFQFKTLPLTVVSMSPLDGQINVSQDATIRFTFNTSVDTVSLLSQCTFNPPIDSAGLVAQAASSPTSCAITHAPLMADTLYTITLTSGISDIYGEPMGKDFAMHFRTKK